jgi:hypothetical protein
MFWCCIAIAQEVNDTVATTFSHTKAKHQIHLKAGFKTDFILGNSYIASGDSPALGFKLQGDLQVYKSFQFGLGISYSQFKNLDRTNSGLVEQTNMFVYSLNFGYLIHLNNVWSVSPTIKFANVTLYQKTAFSEKRFKEEALMFRAGGSINYQFTKAISSFIDAEFGQIYYDIESAPQLRELFQKDSFISLSVGLRYSFQLSGHNSSY